jgi:hypothetical protein
MEKIYGNHVTETCSRALRALLACIDFLAANNTVLEYSCIAQSQAKSDNITVKVPSRKVKTAKSIWRVVSNFAAGGRVITGSHV